LVFQFEEKCDMQVPQFIAPYQMAVCSMDVLPHLTKDQHILLLQTR